MPGFQSMLRLMRDGRCWVKLTGPYRISSGKLPYGDVTPFAHALLDAAPQQVVWGTDWPHVMVKSGMPNDGDLTDLLSAWVPDARVARAGAGAESRAALRVLTSGSVTSGAVME